MHHSVRQLGFIILLQGCSLGGIVDNGDRDTGDANTSKRQALVLNDYQVDLPFGWQVSAGLSPDTASLESETQSLSFTKGRIDCTGPTQTNPHGIVIQRCDDTHALLQPSLGEAIVATFSVRSEQVEAILASFQFKSK